MMLSTVTPSRRPILVGGVFLVVALAYLAVVKPLNALYDSSARRITEATEHLTRFEHAAAQRETLRARLSEVDPSKATRGLFPAGPSDAIIAAQITDTVRSMIETAGGTVVATEALPPEDAGTVWRLGARIQFIGRFEVMVATLKDVANAEPALIVDGFEIRVQETHDFRMGNARGISTSLAVYGVRAETTENQS